MLTSLFLLSVITALSVTEACQCPGDMYDNLDEYCKFDVAVFGKATSQRMEAGPADQTNIYGHRAQTAVYTFQVETQYKPYHENDGGTVELRTIQTGMSCDTGITLDERVFIMANMDEEGKIWFDLCDPKFYWDLWGDPMNKKELYTFIIPRHCQFNPAYAELVP